MRILVYLMNFGVDSRWSDIFLLALYRDKIFICITLSLSEVSTHQPGRLFPKPLARTFTPFFFLEQSRTELLPSALPKPLPAPCRPSRAPCHCLPSSPSPLARCAIAKPNSRTGPPLTSSSSSSPPFPILPTQATKVQFLAQVGVPRAHPSIPTLGRPSPSLEQLSQ